MFKQMKISEQRYEGKIPSKKLLGKMPTVTVMSRNKRKEKLPRLPTPGRATLASTR